MICYMLSLVIPIESLLIKINSFVVITTITIITIRKPKFLHNYALNKNFSYTHVTS